VAPPAPGPPPAPDRGAKAPRGTAPPSPGVPPVERQGACEGGCARGAAVIVTNRTGFEARCKVVLGDGRSFARVEIHAGRYDGINAVRFVAVSRARPAGLVTGGAAKGKGASRFAVALASTSERGPNYALPRFAELFESRRRRRCRLLVAM